MGAPFDPPGGYALRIATVDDAGALADLINEVNIAEVGVPWTDPDEVRGDLTAPDRDPDDDLVLVDADGTIAAYLTISMESDDAGTTANPLAWVRPVLWGRGLSRWLLELGERRVEQAPRDVGRRIVIHLACWSSNEAARRLFDALAYAPVRTFMQMRLEPVSRTPAEAPTGIEIRPFRPTTDARAAHAALAEAFDDHWGRAFDPFERWLHDRIEGPGASFDPGLWFLALDGDDVVGVITARPDLQSAVDTASVDALAVRRAWRGRGIARALLLTTFEAVRRRGIGAIELGVDAGNPTGARRLYEGVGMRMIRSFEIWEKELSV